MNLLSTIYSLGLNTLAQAPAPKQTVEPSTPIFGSDGYIGPVQLVLLLVLIGLVVFYFYYKKKQQNQ